MIIGLLKEEKVPVDQRVPLSPLQCKKIKLSYPNIDVLVQSSHNRCFSDDDYRNEGIEIVDDISVCDYLLGVKEVPVDYLIPNKTYLFFSHTIKKQPYNRNLLVKMIEMNINMIDYEVLKDKQGERLLGFGRYAGIIGAYNAFLTYGLKTGSYVLKSAYKCHNRLEMESQLRNLRLNNERIVVTGNGRVGKGILEIMKISGIKKVSIHEFLNDIFSEPIFVHLDTMDYNERIDGANSEKYDFYKNPFLYRSSFLRFAEKADIFIAAFLIVILALFFQYTEKISKSKINNFVSQLISLGYAIPGAVIALALIIFFSGINKLFPSIYLLGSLFILIYALIVRFLAVGKSPIKSSFEKHPESFDDTAKNLGLGPFKILQKIHLPINLSALIIAFIVTFVDLMKELPITLILRPFNFDTLATQTYEFAIEEMLKESSIYSLIIILIGCLFLFILKNIINNFSNAS